jgi:hypothetical protein
LKNPLQIIRHELAIRPPRAWILQILPVALLISFLTSVGPEIQRHATSVVTSDAPTIYSAVYDHSITQFATLSEWLGSALAPPFLIVGLLVAHLSLRLGRLWTVAAAVAFWTAVFLTLMDIVALAFAGELSIGIVFQNIIANILGGIAVAAIVGVALPVYHGLSDAFPDSTAIAKVASGAILVALGTGLSVLSYLALYTFFQPVPVRISAVLDPPVEGYFAPPTQGGDDARAERNEATSSHQFSLLPDETAKGSVRISSPKGQMLAGWAARSPRARYDLEVRLVGNCYDVDLSTVRGGQSALVRKGIREASLKFDDGFSMFQASSPDGGRFRFDAQAPVSYWLRKNPRGLQIEYFVSAGDQFSLASSGKVHFFLGAILMRYEGPGRGSIASRTVELTIDGKTHRLALQFASRGVTGSSGKCRAVSALTPFAQPKSGSGAALPVSSVQVGLLLTLTPTRASEGNYDANASAVSVRKANGWLVVSDLAEEDLRRSEVGSARLLSFKGKPIRVEVDGKAIDANEFVPFIAFGRIDGDILQAGRVKLDGVADKLWMGSTRVNPTRWERLAADVQLWIIGGLLALLVALARIVWWPVMKRYRDEDVNDWVE